MCIRDSIYIGSGTTLTDVHIRDMRLSAAKVVSASGAVLTLSLIYIPEPTRPY